MGQITANRRESENMQKVHGHWRILSDGRRLWVKPHMRKVLRAFSAKPRKG